MAISGFNPTAALPGIVPGATTMAAGSSQLPLQGRALPSAAALAAQAGVVERPGIGARLVAAMRAAVSELRGEGASDAQIRREVLAMQAQRPVTLAKRPVATKAKTFTDKAGNVRQIGTGKIVKAAVPRAGVAAPASPAAPTQQPVGGALPTNATQLPGATVYSYDANGNPVAPTMQQLGITPTMLQGITGMAQAADPAGPQLNATNQTNVGGLGSGFGTAVPVLGQPITVTPAATPAAPGAGGNQSVTNRNATDVSSRNQGLGWGSGWGDGISGIGGVATPYTPYGSSMTGAYALGGQNRGFFSRMLGL